MLKRFHEHMCAHYSAYSLFANLLNAVAMAGLAYLGILTDTMALNWLIGWGIMFAALFGLGRLLNQEIEDLDKVMEHKCHDKLLEKSEE